MVNINSILSVRRSWRYGFIAATGLSLFAVITSVIWQAGFPEWAFVLSFLSLWILLSLFWSNDDFNEESGLILAEVMDNNFEDVHERLQEIEYMLKETQPQSRQSMQKAA